MHHSGDFNGDRYADLAVGVPYEDVGSTPIVNGGAVNVLYVSGSGITASGSDYWHQDSTGIGSIAEDDDRFGFALTADDFDGDGYADLAVGVPYEHWSEEDTGIVQVLYGSSGGVTGVGDQLWRLPITRRADVTASGRSEFADPLDSPFLSDTPDETVPGIPVFHSADKAIHPARYGFIRRSVVSPLPL